MPVGDEIFLVQDGNLIIEAETAELTGDWENRTVDGERSVLWDADRSSYGRVPDGETLSYHFYTDEAGNYRIALHSGRIKSTMNNSDRYEGGEVGGKERTDTGNDAYVSIVNVETGEVVQKPTKLFTGLGGADRDLKWGTTFDANHKKSPAQVTLDANTEYRLEITGRSDGYVLDRITLSNDGFLRDADAPQSPIVAADELDRTNTSEDGSNGGTGGQDDTGGAGGSAGNGQTGEVALTLINAATDQAVEGGTLTDGAKIDVGNGNLNQLNVRADVSGANADSADFYLNGTKIGTEGVEPYALFGDTNGDYNAGSLAEGQNTLKVVFKNADGAEVGSKEITFDIEGGSTGGGSVPPASDGGFQPFIDDGLVAGADQIVFHFDGNINDPDDIAAVPVAAALIKAAGLEDKTTFFINNNLMEGAGPNQYNGGQADKMRASGEFAESLGITVYDYMDDAGATDALADILNSGQQILSIEGGPMEAIYRGLENTDTDNLSNITLLSHSSWNENRDNVTRPDVQGQDARTWSDLKLDFGAVEFVDIRDQNDGNNNDRGFNNSSWTQLLNDTDHPVLKAMQDVMVPAGNSKKNDPSDAGMLFFGLTGIDNGTPQEAMAYLQSSPLLDFADDTTDGGTGDTGQDDGGNPTGDDTGTGDDDTGTGGETGDSGDDTGAGGDDTGNNDDGTDNPPPNDDPAPGDVTTPNMIEGDANDNRMFGSRDGDFLLGYDGDDKLLGRQGDDELNGGDGEDLARGGKGDDTINGGAMNDHLKGGRGSDALDGGNGDDILKAHKGSDLLIGGGGNDLIYGGRGKNDQAQFSGTMDEYEIVKNGRAFEITHLNGGADGTDTLRGVEELVFEDQTISISDFLDAAG